MMMIVGVMIVLAMGIMTIFLRMRVVMITVGVMMFMMIALLAHLFGSNDRCLIDLDIKD